MKTGKTVLVLLLAVLLCFALAACGADDSADDEQIVGDDWRTWGTIDDYGTITLDGEETEVCVCVGEDDASFYYDEPEQLLFDYVDYPMNIPDAAAAYTNISFEDMNGDGDSDVRMDFSHEDGSATTLVWFRVGGEFVFQEDASYTTVPGGDLTPYMGLWAYPNGRWLRIGDDSTWDFVNAQVEVLESGTAVADENGIDLHEDGSGAVYRFELTADDMLQDMATGDTLARVDAIVDNTPYFEKNELYVYGATDNGTYLRENGVATYCSVGEGYATGDVYWEVTVKRSDVHDGIREIEFDAVCYIPYDSVPMYSKEYIEVTSGELYDAYTGVWLTASSTYEDTGRGENHYVHTIDWNGESYEIEFFYSTQWERTADWENVLTKSYVVYMPEAYDGLIFGCMAMPDNYKETAKRLQLDSICPDAEVLDLETIDARDGLYFYIYE